MITLATSNTAPLRPGLGKRGSGEGRIPTALARRGCDFSVSPKGRGAVVSVSHSDLTLPLTTPPYSRTLPQNPNNSEVSKLTT